jgi:hypothetical protein
VALDGCHGRESLDEVAFPEVDEHRVSRFVDLPQLLSLEHNGVPRFRLNATVLVLVDVEQCCGWRTDSTTPPAPRR